MNADVLVIGAGPAGIGVALSLGKDATVLESQQDVAGLSRTIDLDGAIFDLGGHSFHTPHPAIRALVFDALEMEEQAREAWVWLAGDWVRYPFQKHFLDLRTAAIRQACEAGLANRVCATAAANFDEHIAQRFGAGITEHFMRPYNQKLWGDDLQRMEADWTAERIAAPQGVAEQFDTAGGLRTPLQAGTQVAYPARGGFGEIFKALARQIASLRLGQAAVAIDPVKRNVTTAGGETYFWSRLVSTLPLPRLLALLPDVPAGLSHAAARLEALPVSLVMLTFDGKLSCARQRVYNPGRAMLGHKIVLNNTSSLWLRGQPRHGIQVEIAGNVAGDPIPNVVGGLTRMGLIGKADSIVATKILRLPMAYPVPTHGRREIIAAIRRFLLENKIYTAGRFGEWDYINADEALHRGMRLGAALAAGTA